MKYTGSNVISALVIFLLFFCPKVNANTFEDTTFLRISIHIFADSSGNGNFNADSSSHTSFLLEMVKWINHQLVNLDTLRPAMPSAFVSTTDIQVRLDSIFYHNDQRAWDCSEEIDSDYMRTYFVDHDTTLNYRQKYQTLPIFLGNNYHVVGGHNSLIGDKRFIAMRGMFSEFLQRPYPDAVRDCGRALLHELGHALGLSHNFSGGSHGEQCDECEDNGCPDEGSSNNIMDYWPSYGYALSVCQLEIIKNHLNGKRGTIAAVICHDSCYIEPDRIYLVSEGSELIVKDTMFIHGDMLVDSGGSLVVEGYLSFPEGTGLIISPGAEVLLKNGTLGNLCGDLWKGIQFLGNRSGPETSGSLILQGGIIENAETGILTDCMESIQLEGVTFRNNRLAMDIRGSIGPGIGEIDSCLFEIKRRINHWETGQYPAVFVKLRGDVQLRFKNCQFYNKEGHRIFEDENSGIGIFVDNAGLLLEGCSFVNLFKGIYVSSKNSHHIFRADSSRFELCHCGIQLNNFPRAAIVSCDFSLNRLNTMPSIGVSASNVVCMHVRDNTFISDYGGEQLAGIILNHTYPGTSLIEDNMFELLQTGILTSAGSDLPEWPASLTLSASELLHLPLGTIWKNNLFAGVKQEIVEIFPDGHGLATASLRDFSRFDIATSREFPVGGFGPFSPHQDYFSFILPISPSGLYADGMLFFALTDSSWISKDFSDLDLENLPEFVSGLTNIREKGKVFPWPQNQLTHKDLVTITQHIKTFPWLLVETSVKQYIFERIDKVPLWFWNEIQAALSQADPWKMNFHELIIFLAKQQMVEQNPISDFIPLAEPESILASVFLPIDLEPLPDLKKLNAGVHPGYWRDLFSVVPNPNSGEFGIRFNHGNFSSLSEMALDYKIRTRSGQLVESGKIQNTQSLLINIRPASPGSYLIEIWDRNEFLGIQKFIILSD